MKKVISLIIMLFLALKISPAQSIQLHLVDGSQKVFLISQIDSITFSRTPVNDGLIAYYPFNGNAGDYSINGNNGTVHGASLTTDRFGNSNSAYDFNGVNNYIEIPDNSTLRPASITIAGWIYPRSIDVRGIVYKSTYSDASNEQYALEINASSQFNSGIKRNSSCLPGAGWNNVTSTKTISLNQWSFVCITWDGSLLKAYINGVLISTNTSVPAGAIDACSGGTLRLGIEWQASGGHPFNGKLDDFRFYNRALSDSEVQLLYTE